MAKSLPMTRRELRQQIFPAGVPILWCPPLTHYDAEGKIDAKRIGAHLEHLSKWVKGFLIPGSTGDGWELSDSETWELLDIAFDQARRLDVLLLVGVLKKDAAEMKQMLENLVRRIQARTGEKDVPGALAKARVCGFTVCAPAGKDLTQDQLKAGLTALLELRLPIAIYQLPQVTGNELSPESAADLAQRFQNFLLFKDSSGEDRVLCSGKNLDGVFAFRGAEGNYARWLKPEGPYDGFLLSTTNCFGRELSLLIDDLTAGESEAAQNLSKKLTSIINESFALASKIPQGNPFANANKLLDHFLAYGPNAEKASPPRLHGGKPLPAEAVLGAKEILASHGMLPRKGYLE